MSIKNLQLIIIIVSKWITQEIFQISEENINQVKWTFIGNKKKCLVKLEVGESQINNCLVHDLYCIVVVNTKNKLARFLQSYNECSFAICDNDFYFLITYGV